MKELISDPDKMVDDEKEIEKYKNLDSERK